MKRADYGGSGQARPDAKMGRQRGGKRRRVGSGHYALRWIETHWSTGVRQAAQRKSNAKRRRRDKERETDE